MNAGRLLLALCVGLLPLAQACSNDASDNDGDSSRTGTGIFGVVLNTSGQPIANARVSFSGGSATTDASGQFVVRASAGRQVVRAEADGFVFGVRDVDVFADQSSAVEFRLLAESPAVVVNADEGGEAAGPRGAQVTVPAGGLVDASGAAVTGNVNVHLTPLDPTVAAELAAAPELIAVNNANANVLLESYGMMDITIRQDGEELQIANGQTMDIVLPAPAGATGLPDTMPLWSFNETTGQWEEEGVLTLSEDGSGWVGTISHMSMWNADIAVESGCVSGTVVDAATGAPIPGAAISSRGVDYSGYSDATAGADGTFRINVRINSRIAITAFHASTGSASVEVSSSGIVSAVPPTATDSCVDVGTIEVERGLVEFPDGRVVECNLAQVPDIEGCQPVYMELLECFSPAGACTTGGGPFNADTEYENGSRITFEFGSDGTSTSYFGPGGQPCGTQTFVFDSENPEASSAELLISLASGAQTTFRFGQGANDSYTMTCANGSTLTVTAEEQIILQACNGDSDAQECAEADPEGPGTLGTECLNETECNSGLLCCSGICNLEFACELDTSCTSNDECTDGSICCSNAGSSGGACTSAGQCYDGISCGSNADCGNPGDTDYLCCDGSCQDVFSCSGECNTDSDCSADSGGICCATDPNSTYCTDASSCFGGTACTADTDCGGGLSCCESTGTCNTVNDCFAATPCTPGESCPGTLLCCEREDFGGALCLDEFACFSGLPCTDPTDCAEGFTCCAAFGNICVQDGSCIE
jgi:hypothetical protein